MNFDLALTVLPGIAGILFVLGAQRVIDGFELVVAISVTFLLDARLRHDGRGSVLGNSV